MEETQVQAAEPEAPPGDIGADTAVAVAAEPAPSFEADHALELKDDYSNFDEWIRADAERINAEAEAAESAAQTDITATAADDVETPASEPVTATATPPAAAEQSKAPAPTQAEIDEAAALAALQARGYKVEAPPPPPDPYAALTAQLAPYVGTADEYAQTKAAALVALPPEPPSYDADAVAAHEAAVKARNEAAAKLHQMDTARQVTDVARTWARHRVLGELGAELETLPQQYSIPADKATRIVKPTTMADAVAAVVETVTERLNAEWQGKLDAETKKWQGKVKQAQTDRSVARHQEMGSAPQPAVGAGRQAGPGPLYETIPGTNLPTAAAIEDMIAGKYANVNLSDR